jgi:hypothetical protein
MSTGCRAGLALGGQAALIWDGSSSVNNMKCWGQSGHLPFGKRGKLGKQVLTSFGARSVFRCRALEKCFCNSCCLFDLSAF